MRPCIPLLLALLVACRADVPETVVAPRVRVTTGLVSRGDVPRTAALVGRLAPAPGNLAVLSAPADAIVRGVLVQVGDGVSAGQVLLELDVPDLEAQATAQRAVAEAAERDAARQRALLHDGIVAVRAVEEREAAAIAARAAATASASLLARARVSSPIGGRVQRVLVNAGERVAAGTPLAEVIRPGPLDLTADVRPADIADFRPGQRAMVAMEGSAVEAAAAVHAVAPGVDTATNAGRVVVRLPRGSGLTPGAGATATVTLGELRDELLVAEAALVLVGDSVSVFVVRADSTVTHVPVAVAARAGGVAAVRAPLRVGDRVAIVGAYGLRDGMKVEPAP